MYIQTCTFTDNNKHVEQERTVRLSMININIYCNLTCIEKIQFNNDFNVITAIADFICSGILFHIGALSECRV